MSDGARNSTKHAHVGEPESSNVFFVDPVQRHQLVVDIDVHSVAIALHGAVS